MSWLKSKDSLDERGLAFRMDENPRATECLRSLLRRVGRSEFGYRVQGLAAHVLLRLGATVLDVKASGHPDITAQDDQGIMRIEVEADTGSSRERQLTGADYVGMASDRRGDRGYFALLLMGPRVRWVITPLENLSVRSKPLPISTVTSLADVQLSFAWTEAMVSIVVEHYEKIWFYSFDSLRQRSLNGQVL